MASVDAGQVERVTITGNDITGVNKANESFRTYAPPQYEGWPTSSSSATSS
jgi:hypothetical protein